jgi:hypothetical protein
MYSDKTFGHVTLFHSKKQICVYKFFMYCI